MPIDDLVARGLKHSLFALWDFLLIATTAAVMINFPAWTAFHPKQFGIFVFVEMAFGNSIEYFSLFRILAGMSPRFSEMNKVRVIKEDFGECEGYVIASQFRDGRWIYKLSISEDPSKQETYDNWLPEEWLELTK